MEYIIILPITFEVIIGVLMLLLGAGYTFCGKYYRYDKGGYPGYHFSMDFFSGRRENRLCF